MQKRSSPFSSTSQGNQRARARSAEGVETHLRWLRAGAWGLPVVLLLFFLTLGFDASALDLAARVVCLGLVAGMGGLLVHKEKQHARQTLEEHRTIGRFLAASKAFSTLDLATLTQRLADEAVQLIPCRGACAILLDRRRERIEHLVTAGRFPRPQAGDLSILLPKEVRHKVLEQGVVVLQNPHALHARLRSLRVQDFAQQNLLIVGIYYHHQGGFLLLADKHRDEDFHDRDVQLLTAVTQQAAVAIEHARLFAEAQETQTEQHGLLHALINAQEQERKGLVEEWHDRLGTKLFDMLQGFRSCYTLIMQRVPEGRERFEQLAADIDAMAALVRGFTNELHPSVLDDFGFVAALREYVAGLREQEPFHVTVQAEEVDHQLSSEAHLTLFRIIQEALRNIRQHAQASNVQIAFVQEHSGVSLMIKDDGKGFNPEQPSQGHFGLLYMRERAEACGGTFRVVSARGQGTEVRVNFPSGGRAPTRSS
ncbi:MAG TPA: GAF domain-containing sensor histidine kinase [Candidatus Binatia bacterium]|nr:GAF domain-containing sensor histidine kinase [Candidatus Binatia bacterium]